VHFLASRWRNLCDYFILVFLIVIAVDSTFKALIILFDNDVVVDEGIAMTGTFCLTANGPSKYGRWPLQRSYVVI
jgi:hypothetical protein